MKLKVIVLCLSLVFTLSACDSAASRSNDHIQITTLEETDPTEVASENLNKDRIGGEISRVVGNIVTLELFDLPERLGDGSGERESSEGETPPLTGTGIPGQGMGQGGNRSKMTSFEKNGETMALIVPVGTEIRSSASPDMIFEIENLSKGMNVMVFIDNELTQNEKIVHPDSDTVYAYSINIIQSN